MQYPLFLYLFNNETAYIFLRRCYIYFCRRMNFHCCKTTQELRFIQCPVRNCERSPLSSLLRARNFRWWPCCSWRPFLLRLGLRTTPTTFSNEQNNAGTAPGFLRENERSRLRRLCCCRWCPCLPLNTACYPSRCRSSHIRNGLA